MSIIISIAERVSLFTPEANLWTQNFTQKPTESGQRRGRCCASRTVERYGSSCSIYRNPCLFSMKSWTFPAYFVHPTLSKSWGSLRQHSSNMDVQFTTSKPKHPVFFWDQTQRSHSGFSGFGWHRSDRLSAVEMTAHTEKRNMAPNASALRSSLWSESAEPNGRLRFCA